jgi:YegS/Rv2252/BmrU family lipid kinase
VRACVIFNPTARGDKARRFRRRLGEIGAECALKQTGSPEDARRLAAEAVGEGFELVIAAGGDGTINEVLNGIGDAPGGFERARLGVLPLGTVNVFARELGVPLRLDAAWQTLRQGHETRVDLPRVEFSSGSATARRHFAQLAGAGLDARAIELVNWPLKKRIGPLAYVVAGLRALLRRQPPITFSDGDQTASGELVLVGNGRLYGGSFAVFPQAAMQDGLLEVCVFPRANWLTLLRCGPALLLRKRLPAGAARCFKAASFTLTGSREVPLEADGEWIGRLPAQFSIQRAALRVIVP